MEREREVVTERPVATERVVERHGGGGSAVGNIVYLIFGILEALLAFRFVFKLLGANAGSGFVSFIYGVTNPLVAPFYGIFGQPIYQGNQATATLDFSTLIAMAVYALIGWVIVRIIAAATNRPTV